MFFTGLLSILLFWQPPTVASFRGWQYTPPFYRRIANTLTRSHFMFPLQITVFSMEGVQVYICKVGQGLIARNPNPGGGFHFDCFPKEEPRGRGPVHFLQPLCLGTTQKGKLLQGGGDNDQDVGRIRITLQATSDSTLQVLLKLPRKDGQRQKKLM